MKAIVIATQVLGALTLVPWSVIAVFTVVQFAAPKAREARWIWFATAAVAAYPILMGVCFWRAWAMLLAARSTEAVIVSCAPLAIAAVVAIALAVIK